MTATRTITLTFDLAARTEGELPSIEDVLTSLGNKTHGLPPSWWSQDRGYWITAIGVPPQPADDAEAIKQGEALRDSLKRDWHGAPIGPPPEAIADKDRPAVAQELDNRRRRR